MMNAFFIGPVGVLFSYKAYKDLKTVHFAKKGEPFEYLVDIFGAGWLLTLGISCLYYFLMFNPLFGIEYLM